MERDLSGFEAVLERTGACVASEVEIADTFGARFLGLMGRSSLPRGRALLLTETGSIHMMFMRFPIDAVFLDEAKRVVSVREGLRPWLGLAVAPSDSVLELSAGVVSELGIRVEDRILLRSTSCHS